MIDGDGHACLTDIGLTSIVHGGNSSVSLQGPNMINTTAWAAPEVLAGAPVSKEGDIFTFAMVAVEVWKFRQKFWVSHSACPGTDIHRPSSVPYELPSRDIRNPKWGPP